MPYRTTSSAKIILLVFCLMVYLILLHAQSCPSTIYTTIALTYFGTAAHERPSRNMAELSKLETIALSDEKFFSSLH